MSKKIKLELTVPQFKAVCNVTDAISAMLGVGSDFDLMGKDIILIDRMLKKNGYERKFK